MRQNSSPRISFDANAGVPATTRALEKFVEIASKFAANPASNNQEGRAAQAVIEKSKLQIAEALGCAPNELFFTSGATEANNLAIHGLISDLEQQFGEKPILVSSKAEHPSCLAYLRVLQQRGYKLELLALDPHARFDINNYAFNDDCYLIVGQWANNETGAIQDIAACAAIAGDANNIRWHCDAVQGIGKTLFDNDLLVADSFSISNVEKLLSKCMKDLSFFGSCQTEEVGVASNLFCLSCFIFVILSFLIKSNQLKMISSAHLEVALLL